LANRLIEQYPVLVAEAVPQGLQAPVPFAFENIGDKPVSGIDFHEAALGQLGGLAAALHGLLGQGGDFIVSRLHFRLDARPPASRARQDRGEVGRLPGRQGRADMDGQRGVRC